MVDLARAALRPLKPPCRWSRLGDAGSARHCQPGSPSADDRTLPPALTPWPRGRDGLVGVGVDHGLCAHGSPHVQGRERRGHRRSGCRRRAGPRPDAGKAPGPAARRKGKGRRARARRRNPLRVCAPPPFPCSRELDVTCASHGPARGWLVARGCAADRDRSYSSSLDRESVCGCEWETLRPSEAR